MEEKLLKEIEKKFLIRRIKEVEPISTGNINYTFKVKADNDEEYILQQINTKVFSRPEEIMQNIRRINRFLEKKVLLEGGNPKREVLHPIDTLNGSKFLIDENGEYWRMYNYIANARTYDTAESKEMFYEVGKAFGKFQNRLADYPTDNLHEAIPDFHNTPKRFKDFQLAILADKSGRLQAIKGQKNHPLKLAIDYIINSEEEINLLMLGKISGELPYRVTHNDTKINNVMIDNETKEAICVIDLDTAGPDTVLVDFGDAIRSGANPAGEEPEKIQDATMDIELFEAYTRGYLGETIVMTEDGTLNEEPKKGLTKNEILLLHKSPRILTLELAMRFIEDYLNGDEYFKLKDNQPKNLNLKRGLVQIALAEDMRSKEEKMKDIINKIILEKQNKILNGDRSCDYEL